MYWHMVDCTDSLNRNQHHQLQAENDDDALNQFLDLRKAQPSVYGDWKIECITLIQT